MCSPPKGTKAGTMHELANKHSDSKANKVFEWTGKTWSTPKTGYGTKPAFMAALGWKYVQAV